MVALVGISLAALALMVIVGELVFLAIRWSRFRRRWAAAQSELALMVTSIENETLKLEYLGFRNMELLEPWRRLVRIVRIPSRTLGR